MEAGTSKLKTIGTSAIREGSEGETSISMSLHSIPIVDNGRLHHLDAWLHRLEFKPSDVHQPAVSWQRCGFGRSNHRNASERTMCLLDITWVPTTCHPS